MKIGFIGLGNMGSAILGGILKQGNVKPEDIIVTDKAQMAVKKAVEMMKVKAASGNTEVAEQADILFLAIKPQIYETVIKEISASVKKDAVIISIAPGKTIEWIEGLFGGAKKIVRCMPNTPALVGAGCTGVCANRLVTEQEMMQVMMLLNSFGKAHMVPENLMDTVVGVSGSSPAYVFMFIEAMADAAVADGMPRPQAYEFAAQAVYGSAKMVLDSKMHPGALKDMVCSPGGTTIEAVRVLEEKGFRSAVIEAQKACVEKSKNM
ncbi:MAG: pyrroline-5-carboxylate reductase [Lachnospiraceae bacterium]|nr:pyrroline-5-carboxylate reductase [Lachnospiraceae bacterium]